MIASAGTAVCRCAALQRCRGGAVAESVAPSSSSSPGCAQATLMRRGAMLQLTQAAAWAPLSPAFAMLPCVASVLTLLPLLLVSFCRAVASGLSAPEVWDALPFLAKLQIIGFIGVLEHISEDKNFLAADGMTHYMRGGKPGYMPTFSANVHPLPLNLYDPFRLSKNMDEATKAKRLNMEVNNGRLAMIGIFGFVCANTIPGSVPLLDGVIPAYSGAIMQPFNPVGTMESVWTVGKMW